MKRKRPWRPGRRSRRGMGTMCVSRRRNRRLTHRSTVPGKEGVILGTGS